MRNLKKTHRKRKKKKTDGVSENTIKKKKTGPAQPVYSKEEEKTTLERRPTERMSHLFLNERGDLRSETR